ncbi:MAG: SDR family oxidoreductase [Flavobacteriales bacterium]
MCKTILITGASSGIGRTAAIKFASEGWKVAATMRHPEKESELQKNSNIRLFQLDVTQKQSVDEAIAAVIQEFGNIDVLVNNAGFGVDGVFEGMSDELIRSQFETNVFGLMRTTRAVIPHMRERRSGMIIQISSMGGRTTFPLYSIYHGTKWAVEGFTESLHYELKPFGIAVKLIEPGAIKTAFYSTSRISINPPDLVDYSEFVEKCNKLALDTGKKGASPERVAEKILTVANSQNSTMRHPIAYPAGIMTIMRRILPDSWTFAFTRMNYKI